MTRQVKVVSVAILIPCIYGLIIWIETGFFALPFPLLDLIFAVTVVAFVRSLTKRYPYASFFSFAFALTHLLAQPFIWSFFIPDEDLPNFTENGTRDLFKFISACFYIGWGAVSIFRCENKFRIAYFLVFLASFSTAVVFDSNELLLFSSLMPYLLSFWYKDIQPFHLLWLLFAVFEWMKWLMNYWIVE